MVKPHQAKANAKATLPYWVYSISSLPATPSKNVFAQNMAGNWVQNPFCRDLVSEIAFALVWLNHKREINGVNGHRHQQLFFSSWNKATIICILNIIYKNEVN